MSRYIFRKTQRFVVISVILIAFIAVYIFALLTFPVSHDENKNQIRISTNRLHSEIERIIAQGRLSEPLPESAMAYAVFDIHGNNLGSTIPKYQGDLDVRFLSTIKEYTAPLVVDGTQVGILVIENTPQPQRRIAFLCSLPVFALCSAVFLLLALHKRFVSVDILRPVNELHDVVGRMVKGDLSVSVSYDYEGEMGGLCHDFEAMRDELRDAAMREQSHKDKERLLFASLSHDLKTPLSSILGYAEGIKYGVVKEQPDIVRYVDIILKKTNALIRSIEDILTHIQTQVREMSIKKEELYSGLLFDKLLSDAANDAASKGLTLDIIGGIPNVLVAADPMRIEQVVQNIIGNALKYTQRGGRITVSAWKKSSELHFAIEDTGCGIKPEDVPFVFEPFFRGEKSRDPNISGSGLGLSIAKYIVEQHAGNITCESNFGEGTMLEFSIPVL